MAVGKEITFTSSHSLPPNEDVPRDLGNGEINGHDLATELLKNGWAKVKEIKREPTEEDTKRKELETEAKNAGRGVWNPHGPKVRVILCGLSVVCCFPLESEARAYGSPVWRTCKLLGHTTLHLDPSIIVVLNHPSDILSGSRSDTQHADRLTSLHHRMEGQTD